VKRLAIIGSTGSIGVSALDVVAAHPDRFEVTALGAGDNTDLLAEQVHRFGPRIVAVKDAAAAERLRQKVGDRCAIVNGISGQVDVATYEGVDMLLSALVGAIGLQPTFAAIRAGRDVALANKETLVCTGALMTREVMRCGATLLPVDSEHNAIFQVLDHDQPEAVERIILTASGGPFREMPLELMAKVTPEQAVAHPNWDMGAKISVDSATMMNKGLELIEAHHLFGLPEARIEILVHPQSVVHSMVAYSDGSVLAQMSQPDMRTPIAYTLAWPGRMAAPVPRLEFTEIGQLTFEAPDSERFPSLRLARQALQAGGSAPTVLNAANEVAVAAFLAGKLGFLGIAEVVERTLEEIATAPLGELDDVWRTDREARRVATSMFNRTL